MTLDKLSKSQRDKLCRISQQGMQQAAAMLSRLLKRDVDVEVADAWMSDCCFSSHDNQGEHIGVFMQVQGDVNGGLLLVLAEKCASWLCAQLLGAGIVSGLQEEPASSTLKEVGNILASAFLASLGDQLELSALPSPPELKQALLGELLLECRPACEETCLIVRTRLLDSGENAELQGAIYLFPENDVLDNLLARIS